MLLKISHTTNYTYDSPVQYALQQARLKPKSGGGQTVISWKMNLDGAEEQISYNDEYNNHVVLLGVLAGRSDFAVNCEGEVETTDNSGILGQHHGFAPLWHFQRSTPLTAAGPLVKALSNQLGTDFSTDVERFHALSNIISSDVAYEIGTTDISTTAEAALAGKCGVCQDHAHIFISCARHMGFPARYVSGYLMMDDRVEQDATHAWAEVFFTGIGWVGFDVSNGISPDGRYVRVATGLDYQEAAPVSGLRFGNSNESMIVSIQVQQ
ncbi:MAG: transglutaminase family protein [Salaquimonas sp.]